MRWLFVFLMLANAIVLFWYASTQPRAQSDVVLDDTGLGLPLVSEMPESQLLARVDPVRQGLVSLTPSETVSCFVIGETYQLATAQRIMNFFSERGQNAFINQRALPRPIGHEVILAAPDGDAARLSMLSQLDQMGIEPESRMENGRLQFVVGTFVEKEMASRQLRQLKRIRTGMRINTVSVNDWSYSVQINGPFDHEISSKINGIVRKAYPSIKIEKKLCKGVASP
ncbi:MAG: hypothetical protein OIF57_07105 [Marinobacterium sp.]|nr:hypothetical protein [Marinobacterium sp.]